MKKVQGVYLIRNKIDGRVYVGSGVHVNRRFFEHRTKLKRGNHDNSNLQRAWNKHGRAEFEFLILEEVEATLMLTEREQHWADYYNVTNPRFGYNMHSKARNVMGVKFPFYRP